jgi:hypothetical protein
MPFTAYEHINRMMILPLDVGCICNKANLTAAFPRAWLEVHEIHKDDIGSSFKLNSLGNCNKLSVIHIYIYSMKWNTVFPFNNTDEKVQLYWIGSWDLNLWESCVLDHLHHWLLIWLHGGFVTSASKYTATTESNEFDIHGNKLILWAILRITCAVSH